MSTEQPDALKLADQLRDMSTKFKTPSHERGVCNGAIEKLRRLHALNQELVEALRKCSAQLTRLGYSANHADAALAKATGETK